MQTSSSCWSCSKADFYSLNYRRTRRNHSCVCNSRPSTRFRKHCSLCIDLMTGFVSYIQRLLPGNITVKATPCLKWELYIQHQLVLTAKSQSVNGSSVFYILEASSPRTQRAIFRTHHLMMKCSWEGFMTQLRSKCSLTCEKKTVLQMKWNNIYCFTVTHSEADKLQPVTAEWSFTVLLKKTHWCRETGGGQRVYVQGNVTSCIITAHVKTNMRWRQRIWPSHPANCENGSVPNKNGAEFHPQTEFRPFYWWCWCCLFIWSLSNLLGVSLTSSNTTQLNSCFRDNWNVRLRLSSLTLSLYLMPFSCTSTTHMRPSTG